MSRSCNQSFQEIQFGTQSNFPVWTKCSFFSNKFRFVSCLFFFSFFLFHIRSQMMSKFGPNLSTINMNVVDVVVIVETTTGEL